MNPQLSEARRHAIVTLAELDDWDGVEGLLSGVCDEYWSRREVRDAVVDGVLRDMDPPVVMPGATSAALVVVLCIFAGALTYTVAALIGA